MLNELAARKLHLKKTETKAPKNVEKLLCEDSETYNKLMSETFMEEYYSDIEEFSFQSVFFELSKESARAIHDAFLEWSTLKDPSNVQATYEKYPQLQSLAQDIEEKTKSLSTAPNFFIRLSTRSPKDAVLYSPKFRGIYENALRKVFEKDDGKSTKENNSLVALYEALTVTMKNQTGAEAVQLLITSQRIQGDLETYAMDDSGNSKSFQVVLRDWYDFEVYNEFRAFIYQKKITGITQYNEYCYFPHLHENKEEIGAAMKEQVELAMLPKITKLQNLVLDLILCRDGDSWSVKVVEINPLAEFAGTGLFSWEDDRDTLLGNNPFEFRIQEHTPENAMKNLPPTWANFIQKYNEQ